jgi:hypothetical protein
MKIRSKVPVFLVVLLAGFGSAWSKVHITHQYTNTDAQSLIGLPMGNHKTIIDKEGNLRWSQWSIQRRGLEVPFGISQDMDGALDIQLSVISSSGTPVPLKASGQELYRERFPFVVTHLAEEGLKVEEVAFPAGLHSRGLDVVRITFTSSSPGDITVAVHLTGKDRNLPAFASGSELATHDGHLVVLAEGEGGEPGAEMGGLVLTYRLVVPGTSSRVLWLKRPYDFLEKDKGLISGSAGSELLESAEQSWGEFWSRGVKIELPEKEIEDFYYSSLAYLFINTEYDEYGGLWTLDGPSIYRHYWGRSEYFMARAMDGAGYLDASEASIDHAFRLQKDDGRWDMPPISNNTAWDAVGDYMATIWDYYRFTRDRKWLWRAYPYLMAAARWIHYSREETKLPVDAPPAVKPFDRPFTQSCKDLPNPALKPGEKPFWWGLLPWGYGDSGLPDGHAFAHNVMPLYGLECARQAAVELGQSADAGWLSKEYADYKDAIMTSIHRSVGLEKDGPPYLPAMPTYPEAAYSQTFLATFPTGLFSPNDPLVTGLLTRMERTERQGLPTNVAWLGRSGVWPGESMSIAETYLLRGEIDKLADLLIAVLNHSYFTKVWKEEIRVDKTLPTACDKDPPSQQEITNQTGTGDMPEAWAHGNLVVLVRDMLLREEGNTLHLLSGIPGDWISVGGKISMQDAPTMLGGKVSYTLSYTRGGEMTLDLTAQAGSPNVVVHFPLAKGQSIDSARVNGRPAAAVSGSMLEVEGVNEPLHIEVAFK